VTVPLLVRGKGNLFYEYGTVSIPPKLIPVGWSVEIKRVNASDQSKPKPSSKAGDCDKENKQSSQDPVTISFDLVIKDEKGRERKLQDLLKARESRGIELSLQYLLKDKQTNSEALRYIYLDDGEPEWSFLDEDTKSGNDDFGRANTTLKHLTSKSSRPVTLFCL